MIFGNLFLKACKFYLHVFTMLDISFKYTYLVGNIYNMWIFHAYKRLRIIKILYGY